MREKWIIRLVLYLLLSGVVTGVRDSTAQPARALDPEKAITQYRLDRWTTEHGLPMNRVQAVLQTSNGYVWLGTQEGLARFDGFTFHVLDTRNSSLPSNDVGALAEDHEGNLWIATNDGLARYRSGRISTYTIEHGLATNLIHSLAVGGDGRLWIGTHEGLYVYENDTFARATDEGRLATESIRAIFEDDEGRIWAGTLEQGVARLHGGHTTVLTTESGLPSDEITAIRGGSQGGVWVGTKAGVAHVDGDFVRTFTAADGLPGNSVRSLWEDSAGSLWIGTEDGGLGRRHEGRFETFGEDFVSSVWALAADMEGNLWIGTQRGGLVRLQDGKFRTYTTSEGLQSNNVYSVVEDRHGDVWVGTIGGGVGRLRGSRFETYSTANGFPSDNAVSLYASHDGSVWIGTIGAGLVHYRNGAFRQFTTADGLPDDTIYNIFEDSGGILWIGTYSDGLVRYDGSGFRAFTTEDGLTHDAITTVVEGSDGTLWLGTFRGGLNALREGRIVATYTTADGLPGDYVSSLHYDADGVLWIATQEGGLTRLQNGRLATISTNEGLFNDTILQILEDDSNDLWMSSNRGLFRVSKTEVHAVMDGTRENVAPVVYDRADGLLTFEFNGGAQPAGWKDSRGRLWFVSNKGVAAIDPERIPVNLQPPPIVIESFVAAGESARLDTAVVLEPGRNRIEIDYVGLSFIASERVAYRYMLDGVDYEWVDAGSRRQAFYTNLPPGEYTFRVLARNADGIWSQEPASLSFYLRPFFYQTAWFKALMLIAFFLAILAVYRLRVRQLTQRQRELERTVEERTRDLREEKEKVEQAKAVIEDQAEQLRELDKVKTRFFGNISHEFRTPLTLNIGPLENALSGVYGPVPEVLQKQLEVMLRNARRLLRLINQLLDLAKLESGHLELKRKRIDVARFVENVVLSFSSYTEKSGIDLRCDADGAALPASIDPEAMEKVLFNLLSNAIKFTPEGGRIGVAARMLDDDHVVIRVRDTGSGIPESELPHIFDRFHQVDGAVSRVQAGTGIGLSLVKELVELHGGTIGVESEVGSGTEFTIVLPIGADTGEPLADADEALGYGDSPDQHLDMALVRDASEAAYSGDGAMAIAAAGQGESGVTILVTDDNPDIREYMTGCLSGTYRVVAAKNGLEALEKARQVEPDLIISDVMMPKMTGYELCKAVRADEALKMTPIILVTSKTAVDDKIEGLEAGADDYLPKPFNADELFARVRNLLTLRRQQRELQELNDVLQVKNVELAEASELKSQLLRIAAHDLKNPLNNIREFANLIQEEIEPATEVCEMLGLIQSSSNKMLDIITKILESEALESGQLNLDMKPVDVVAVAAGIVEENRKQAGRKGQEIVFDVPPPGDHVVAGSEEWLVEAMENLLSNAIKYSPEMRTIWVTIRRADDRIRYEVRDQGPGLTEDDKKNLFGKFQRLSARPTGGESSTGLGLSIVKQIAEMHGGDVFVESEHGVGSTFTIELSPWEEPVEA